VDLDHLKDLKKLNHTEWKSSDPNNEPLERQFYWRNRWIEEAIHTAVPAFADMFVTESPKALGKLKPERQGPFLIQGSQHEEVMGEVGLTGKASDLLVLKTEPVTVLVLALAGQKLQTCLELEPPTALWSLTEMVGFLGTDRLKKEILISVYMSLACRA
jgi:hypothetical protein